VAPHPFPGPLPVKILGILYVWHRFFTRVGAIKIVKVVGSVKVLSVVELVKIPVAVVKLRVVEQWSSLKSCSRC